MAQEPSLAAARTNGRGDLLTLRLQVRQHDSRTLGGQ
jgi:hypothetical protein